MSPYRLIKGSDKNIAAFEEEISKALAEGYDLANDLVVQVKTGPSGEETLLFQSLINDDALGFEDEDEDEEDFEEEEDDEEHA